jgi:hypothetical protein
MNVIRIYREGLIQQGCKNTKAKNEQRRESEKVKGKEDKEKLTVKPPQVPCDQCLEDRGKFVEDVLVICYCEHNHTAGIYHIKSETWHIFSPMSQEEFDTRVLKGIARAKELKTDLDKLFEQMPAKEI